MSAEVTSKKAEIKTKENWTNKNGTSNETEIVNSKLVELKVTEANAAETKVAESPKSPKDEAVSKDSKTENKSKESKQTAESKPEGNAQIPDRMPETGHLVEVNGKILHYEKVGTGKIVLLLMPGLMGSSRSDFPEQLEMMDRSKFTLIAWDPPGYGYSRAQERIYNKTVYSDDAHLAAAMMKKIGYDKYCVLGWSDGGKTALNLAANYQENVMKVVVWGVVCYRTPQTDKAFYLTKDVENFFDKQMAQRFAQVYGETEYKKFWCKLVDDCYRPGIGRDEKIISEALLKKIHCPAFVLHGINDPMGKKEQNF